MTSRWEWSKISSRAIIRELYFDRKAWFSLATQARAQALKSFMSSENESDASTRKGKILILVLALVVMFASRLFSG